MMAFAYFDIDKCCCECGFYDCYCCIYDDYDDYYDEIEIAQDCGMCGEMFCTCYDDEEVCGECYALSDYENDSD
jgi:hypothetical protein